MRWLAVVVVLGCSKPVPTCADLAVEVQPLCTADHWSPEAIACWKTAAPEACVALLGDARKHYQDHVDTTDCTGAGAKAVALAADEVKSLGPKAVPIVAAMKDMMVKHCGTDRWSAEVLLCFGRAKSSDELQGCVAQLTREQTESLSRDMTALIAELGGKHQSGPADCATAVGNAMAVTAKAPGPMIDRITAMMVRHCTVDKWSAEAVTCLAIATTDEALTQCQTLLSTPQAKLLADELDSMLKSTK